MYVDVPNAAGFWVKVEMDTFGLPERAHLWEVVPGFETDKLYLSTVGGPRTFVPLPQTPVDSIEPDPRVKWLRLP